jgi:hypothetical protein
MWLTNFLNSFDSGDVREVLLAAIVIIVPIATRLAVACIQYQLAIIERKLDRNTQLTQRTLARLPPPGHNIDAPPADAPSPEVH